MLVCGEDVLSSHLSTIVLAVVTEDGSPQGPKTFVLWNPPLAVPDDDTAVRWETFAWGTCLKIPLS